MLIQMLKSKIHRATITGKNLHYSGSLRVDPLLLEKAGLREHEVVLVVNVNNGSRHETYLQVGERGSGEVSLQGAAARLGEVGDLVIVMGFAWCTPEEADRIDARIVLVNERNEFTGYLNKT